MMGTVKDEEYADILINFSFNTTTAKSTVCVLGSTLEFMISEVTEAKLQSSQLFDVFLFL